MKSIINNFFSYAKNNKYDFMVNAYLFLMFTLFPLFYTNNYSTIRHDKFYFFISSSTILFIAVTILYVWRLSKRNLREIKDIDISKIFSSTDIFFFCFTLISIISTLFAYDKTNALIGNNSRNNGLILLVAYFFVYIIISRCKNFKESILSVFSAITIIVSLLGILNFFYLDPLGMFENYSENFVTNFSSTIGNKNLLSSFCAVSIGINIPLFVNEKSKIKYLYLTSSVINFICLLCADSLSGFVAFFVLEIIGVLFYIRNIKKLKRYILLFGIMMLFGYIFSLICSVPGIKIKCTDFLIKSFLFSYLPRVFATVSFIFYAILTIIHHKKSNFNFSKKSAYIYIAIVILIFLLIISAVVYFTFINTTVEIEGFLKYLRIDDKWGTHRGWIWKKGISIFSLSNPFRKLFGYGPDCFGCVMDSYGYNSTMKVLYGEITNCAHNEYLNYLIT
ncbi:MAG: hypothetical protein ACI4QE_02815, partial [Acutalibacteraceae bacterium]